MTILREPQYQAAISAGYAAVGVDGPRFATLDRKSALAAIGQFLAKLTARAPPDARHLQPILMNGLRDLDGRLIPANWID